MAMPARKGTVQQGSGGGGGNVSSLIKTLAGGQGQTAGGSYLPIDYANAIPDDVLPEDLGMSDAQFADAIRSSQVADALQSFNWSAGV